MVVEILQSYLARQNEKFEAFDSKLKIEGLTDNLIFFSQKSNHMHSHDFNFFQIQKYQSL